MLGVFALNRRVRREGLCRGSRLPMYGYLLAVAVVLACGLPVAAEQNMCADCNVLQDRMETIEELIAIHEEAIASLEKSERELNKNIAVAKILANVHLTLESVWIPLSEVASRCGGAPVVTAIGVLREAIQGGDELDVSLAAVVGSVGAGSFMDAIELATFNSAYADDERRFAALRTDLAKSKAGFQATRRELKSAKILLGADLEQGGCEEDDATAW